MGRVPLSVNTNGPRRGVDASSAMAALDNIAATRLASMASSASAGHCLGHRRPGIERTYDRHKYRAEKRAAFEKLAAEVARITVG
jgi:hypothetical protein